MTSQALAGHPAGKKTPSRARRVKGLVGSNGLGAQSHDFETFAMMDPLEQRRTIREGMEAFIVERVANELLHLTVPALLEYIGLPYSTILRKIKAEERLSAGESDRIARVLFVLAQSTEVFASADLAAEWMQRENAMLGGLKPLEALDSQPGYDRVRTLLLRVTHGVTA